MRGNTWYSPVIKVHVTLKTKTRRELLATDTLLEVAHARIWVTDRLQGFFFGRVPGYKGKVKTQRKLCLRLS